MIDERLGAWLIIIIDQVSFFISKRSSHTKIENFIGILCLISVIIAKYAYLDVISFWWFLLYKC